MIDLHTHSTVSDGSDAPEAVVDLAADVGCTAVALTDHDRLDGLAAAARQADARGITFVPGCELSCEVGAGTMHLLVYFVSDGDGPLQDRLAELQHARDTRNEVMVERLAAAGLPVTLDEVVEEAGGMGVGRPHMAAVLVRKGVVTSVQEAFDTYLAKGKPGYVEKARLYPADAIRLALESHGVPVLAHPFTLRLEPPDLEAAVREFTTMGLGGLEALYGRYTEEERAGLEALATRHGLVATGGSDHHGSYKPDLHVGVGRGDLHVPDDVVERLADRRPG